MNDFELHELWIKSCMGDDEAKEKYLNRLQINGFTEYYVEYKEEFIEGYRNYIKSKNNE